MLLRRIVAVDGPAQVRVVLDVRAGFGRNRMTQLRSAGGQWTGRSGPVRMRWTGAAGARTRGDGALEFLLTLEPPPMLFTEEFDTHQHQLRGNLPQAFVHAVMFESAARLARPWDGG